VASLDVVPDWDYAVFSENEVESYLEVPLDSGTHLGFGPVGVTDESQIHPTDRRVVVREIKETGELYLYTSLWIPDDEQSLIAMPSLTMFDKGLFSGRIYFFLPDGTFYWGARFSEGEVISSVTIAYEDDLASTTRSFSYICETTTHEIWYMNCDLDENGGLVNCTGHRFGYIESVTIVCQIIDGGGYPPIPPPSDGGGSGGSGGSDDDYGEMFTVSVSATPANGGTVEGGGSYEVDTEVTLTATANDGYEFVSWSGDSSSSSSSITVTVTEDMSFTATFQSVAEPMNPCANMANKISDSLFNVTLEDLSWLTSANYESGRAYTYFNDNYSFSTHNGAANAHEIAWAPSSSNKIDGFIHTHVSGGLPIFSVSDLLVPGQWNSAGGINDLARFTLGVVTADGTCFLQVTNLAEYQAFYDSCASDIGVNALEWAYAGYIQTSTSFSEAVTNLALFLEANNAGITLMKQSGDAFKQISVNERTNSVSEFFCQ
jgi:uncharacterized repeat protein (TIGR02543 family)